MSLLAREIALAADHGQAGHGALLADTHHLAQRCRLDPEGDLGVDRPVIPEASVIGVSGDPDRELAQRCYAGLARLHAGEDWDRTVPGLNRESLRARLERELDVISRLGFAGYFLTVGEVSDLMSAMDVRHAARGSGVSSLVNHLLGISVVDPWSTGWSSSGSCPPSARPCRTSTSTSNPPAATRSTGPCSSTTGPSGSPSCPCTTGTGPAGRCATPPAPWAWSRPPRTGSPGPSGASPPGGCANSWLTSRSWPGCGRRPRATRGSRRAGTSPGWPRARSGRAPRRTP